MTRDRVEFRDAGKIAQHIVRVKQAGFEPVVEVGGEVGDLVGEVNQLRFQRRTPVQKIFRQLRMVGGFVVARVLDDAFADGESEVEAAMRGVTLLEVFADAEGVEVVVETQAVALEALVEGALAGVAEGRVADVMHQREGLGEVLVQAQRFGDRARDLLDLDGVSEARAEVVGGAAGEDLGLAGEAAKGAGLHNAVAIALEGGPVRALGGRIDARAQRIGGVRRDRAEMQIGVDCGVYGHNQV